MRTASSERRVPVGEHAAQAELEAERARALDRGRAVVEAVQHAARGRPHLLEDRERVLERRALVDHDRQAQLVGERELERGTSAPGRSRGA